MKICQEHWEKLKARIDEHGLSHLIAKSGIAAGRQIEEQLMGDDSVSNYDPLISANFAIWNQALKSFGLAMMEENAPCPLCLKTEIESKCTDPNCSKQTGDDWVRFAADEQKEFCILKGLTRPIN